MYLESPSSSTWCPVTSMDFPDHLSPSIFIIHRSREVFLVTFSISIELLYIGSRWSFKLCLSMWRDLQKYIAYEFDLTSPAVSGSSYLDGFHDGCWWPYSCCFVGCCFQDLFNTACSILVYLLPSFFSIRLVSVDVVHPYSTIDTIAAWKRLCVILSVRSDFHMTDSLSIVVHAFTSRVLFFSVDETLLPK